MFSSRLRHGQGRNRLARALERRGFWASHDVLDLTQSNPTCAGFTYPPRLLEPLSQSAASLYQPQALGLPAARHAVADDFARRGVDVPGKRIVLTASSSESYSLLFKLLGNPGDAFLAPRPSYPLIEHLADLDGVALEFYRLEFHGRWSIDIDQLRETLVAAIAKGRTVRAIIVVSPNNPTGSVVTPAEFQALAALAREHDLALIADEVFADYPLEATHATSVLMVDDVLVFALGGLSKTIGLPQVKLGWIGVNGPMRLVEEALERLETICDTYLSVSTPVQVAAPELLLHGATVREQIHARVRGNLERLRVAAAADPSCAVLPAQAGWYAVVQVPAIEPEETLVLSLLDRTGILVHPGYFFDFEREAFLVMSLLPHPDMFSPAVETLFGEIGRRR